MIVTDIERALKSKPSPKASVTSVIDFPTDEHKAKRAAEEVLDRLRPKALIAIEQPGGNEKGICHYMNGKKVPTVEGRHPV